MNSNLMIPVLQSWVVLCDNCHAGLNLPNPDTLPEPWRRVQIPGWVGSFHACSAACENAIRDAHKK